MGNAVLLLTTLVAIGNNYAISNESRTKTARVFFAQGCDMDPGSAEREMAEAEEQKKAVQSALRRRDLVEG